ncbi:phage terminase small subunit [Intestinibacter bartlettii]|jgi:uncharacterized protein YjcR|uniref:phage terminase small subunit n=1 Tax=Intestinibacter bartlettii TaxID=261299 RepID=UPI002070F7CB|nr:MAG TPA: Small Terminase [Caudoviricetes sp.]DAK01398.1 MAG TPA: Small Terminase [Caudoviricetes sp.]DAR60023.1 MAG TPA: Small Terminase [Caudoviricetes sp.]DAY75371.1 MAG TPA: Small Terminase [Caudoviricetes sp.]
MARARSPSRDKALEIYKQHNGNITNREIASMLNEDEKVIAVWKSRDKWNKVVQQSEQSCTTNKIDAKKTRKASKKANSRLKKESYPLQARPNNKNAVTTGEFESIFFDTLEDDEIKLVDSIEIEKRNLLIHEIQLLTVRERRMLKRIADLKNKEITLKSYKTGIEKDADTDLKEFETALNQIQNIEEALTRVQEKKQKAIDLLHKFDVDEAKLDLEVMKTELAILKQGGDEGPVEDDGFIDALNAQVDEVWNDD